jgi:hypothetical protein
MSKANGQFPFYDSSLGIVFDGVIQHFEEEIEEYLESLPQRPAIDEFRETCRSLFRASQELVQRHPEARSFTKQLFSTFDEQLLKVLFQFELAYDAISELPEAAERIQKLLEFTVEVAPGPAAQRYLARVARCFTWGYEAETLILCRSVLEQVLDEATPDADVFTAFTWKPGAFPPDRREKLAKRDPILLAIGDRIYAACVMGKLTEEEVEFAKIIRDRGDKAVHDAPGFGADTASTVRTLTQLIGKLCSNR